MGPSVIGKNRMPRRRNSSSDARKWVVPAQAQVSRKQHRPAGNANGASMAMSWGVAVSTVAKMSSSPNRCPTLTRRPLSTQNPVGRRGEPAKSRPRIQSRVTVRRISDRLAGIFVHSRIVTHAAASIEAILAWTHEGDKGYENQLSLPRRGQGWGMGEAGCVFPRPSPPPERGRKVWRQPGSASEPGRGISLGGLQSTVVQDIASLAAHRSHVMPVVVR
jgi:hypothetical protein